MSTGSRILSGGVLTFFLLGLTELFSKGQFVVPFPFIMEFCGLMAIAVALVNFRQHRALFSVLLVHGLMGVLGGRFVWETFLDYQDLLNFINSGWLDIFRLIYYLTLAALLCFGFTLKLPWFSAVLVALLFLLAVCLTYVNLTLLFSWHCLAGIAGAGLLFSKKEDFVYQSVSSYLIASGILYLLGLMSFLMRVA